MATMAEQIAKSITHEASRRKYRNGFQRGLGREGVLDAAVRWHARYGAWPRPRDWMFDDATKTRRQPDYPSDSAVYYYWPAAAGGWAAFLAEAEQMRTGQRVIEPVA